MTMASYIQQVPDDVVLDNIFCRLDITSRARFSAVCRSWRDLLRQAPVLPSMPCLFLVDHQTTPTTPTPLLLDPTADTTTQPLLRPKDQKEVLGRPCMAGCHASASLVVYAIHVPPPTEPLSPRRPFPSFVYDPFSGETLPLPLTARHPDGRRVPMGLLHKAQIMSSPPQSSPPCLVAAVADSSNDTCIYICRPRERIMNDGDIDQAADQYWAASAPLGAKIHDLIFHKGDLYCICEGARVFAFELLLPSSNTDGIFTCPTPRCVSEGREEERHNRRDIGEASYFVHYYLADKYSNCSGRGDEYDDQLLVVTQYNQKRVYLGVPKILFDLHRLEAGTGAMARVGDLGDGMLFVGRTCSRSWPTRRSSESVASTLHTSVIVPTFSSESEGFVSQTDQASSSSLVDQALPSSSPTCFLQPPILFGLLPLPLPLPLELKYVFPFD